MSTRAEERHDRDLIEGIVPEQDSRDETVRNIKELLKRPILAKEADGNPYETSSALREHANLADHKEHPYRKLVREFREARQNK